MTLSTHWEKPVLAQDTSLCAIQVQAKPTRVRDQDKDTILDEGRIFGTAVLVNFDGKTYLVTAYHVVSQCDDILFTGRAEFRLAFGSEFIEREFYCNTIADLAIFRLKANDQGINLIEKYKLKPVALFHEAGPDHPEKLTLAALGLKSGIEGETDDSFLGMSGVAVGNPKVLEYRPKNIIYSCTISEFVPARTRIKDAVRNKGLPVKVLSYADNLKMLFLETLSIDKGFSGGPVLISPAVVRVGDTSLPRLAGIILGGNPPVFAGRYAFASPARMVERGIQILNSNKTLLDDMDRDIEDKLTYETKTKWKDRVYEWGSTFSFSGTRVIEAQGAAKGPDSKPVRQPLLISAWAETARTNTGDHVAFLIDGMELKNVCFHSADLTNFQFINCSFENVCFKDAVLNGSTFVDCDFTLPRPATGSDEPAGNPKVEGILLGFGRPLMAYGVQFRNSHMISYTDSSLNGGVVPSAPLPTPAPDGPIATAAPAIAGDRFKLFDATVPSTVENAQGIPIIRFPSRPFDVVAFDEHSPYQPHPK